MTTAVAPLLDLRVNPVEAEPFAHFLPGSSVLHIGASVAAALADGSHAVADVVGTAEQMRCASIAVPHDTPAHVASNLGDTVGEARRRGVRCISFADGHSGASLEMLRQCDAVLVETTGALPVWLEDFIDDDWAWVEIVARLSPDGNDDDGSIHDLSSWVVNHLGPEVPVHFASTTGSSLPQSSLRRARSIGLGDGLHYVYTAPLDLGSSSITLCPGCGEHLIERSGMGVTAYRLTRRSRCHACGTWIPGRFEGVPKGRTAAVPLGVADS